MLTCCFCFFKQKTAYEMRISDWSSDVCSSDLHVIPQGIQHVGRIRAILEAPNSDLPTLMREECLAMLDQIAVLNGWIDAKTARIKELAAATPVSKRLQTIPGVGPLVAMAVETFAPDLTSFHNGRDFARSEEHTSELQS